MNGTVPWEALQQRGAFRVRSVAADSRRAALCAKALRTRASRGAAARFGARGGPRGRAHASRLGAAPAPPAGAPLRLRIPTGWNDTVEKLMLFAMNQNQQIDIIFLQCNRVHRGDIKFSLINKIL